MNAKEELIGKEAQVLYAGRKFKGKIIDETKNTIILEKQPGTTKIIKKNAIIQINGNIIEGEKITKRPEDRIKAC